MFCFHYNLHLPKNLESENLKNTRSKSSCVIDRVSYYISSVEYRSNFKARSFQSSRWLAKTRRKSFTKNELNRLAISLAVDFVNSVTDSKYCKNLFRDQNKTVLRNAERIYGEELLHSSSLPHLICAPCERRLNNAIKFKSVIEETQRVLQENVRAKRCPDVSPSVHAVAASTSTLALVNMSRVLFHHHY